MSEWQTHGPGELWVLPFIGSDDPGEPHAFYAAARIERRLGKWSLELWRHNAGTWGWEFIKRFSSLAEAQDVGFALVRIEFPGLRCPK